MWSGAERAGYCHTYTYHGGQSLINSAQPQHAARTAHGTGRSNIPASLCAHEPLAAGRHYSTTRAAVSELSRPQHDAPNGSRVSPLDSQHASSRAAATNGASVAEQRRLSRTAFSGRVARAHSSTLCSPSIGSDCFLPSATVSWATPSVAPSTVGGLGRTSSALAFSRFALGKYLRMSYASSESA
jgi:hypothetical protein